MLGLEVPTATIVAELIGHWADYPSMMRVGHAARRLGPAGRVRHRPRRAAGPLRAPEAGGRERGAAERRAGRAAGGRPLQGQDDHPGQDGRRQPLLALDQVLAVPAARPRHSGRLPRPATTRSTLQDEHVETLDLDDEPDLVVIEAYITSARRAYRYADHYRAKGAYVCLGGLHPTSLPEEAAQHADSVFCGPGEDTWPAFLRRLPRRPPQAALPLDGAHARRPAAGAPRPDQARALPGAQLAGRQPRLPAPLRLLLQGGLLPRRQVVLRAGGRRRPRRDRPPPRAPPLLPRRQPLRQPAVRRGALRRAARHGPRVAGGRDGAGASCGPASSRRPSRAACAASSSASRRSSAANLRGAAQDAEPGAAGRRAQAADRRRTTPPSAACTTSA